MAKAEIQYKIFIYGIGDSYNSQYIYIPINPPSIDITRNGRVEKVDIIGLGEALIIKDRELKTISWESFLPINKEVVEAIPSNDDYVADPDTTVTAIENSIKSKLKLKLVIYKTDDNGKISTWINIPIFITGFKTIETGGNVGDVNYSITIIEAEEPQIIATTPIGYNTNSNGETKIQVETQYAQPIDPQILDVGAVVDATGIIQTTKDAPDENYDNPEILMLPDHKVTKRRGTVIEKGITAAKKTKYKERYLVKFETPVYIKLTSLLERINFIYLAMGFQKEYETWETAKTTDKNGKTTYYHFKKCFQAWFRQIDLNVIQGASLSNNNAKASGEVNVKYNPKSIT